VVKHVKFVPLAVLLNLALSQTDMTWNAQTYGVCHLTYRVCVYPICVILPGSKVRSSRRSIVRGSKSVAVFLSESVISRMFVPDASGREIWCVRSGM